MSKYNILEMSSLGMLIFNFKRANNIKISRFMRGDGIYIGTMLGDELIKVHNW